MIPILEYIISKSSKRYTIKATNNNIYQIVIDEINRLGHDASLNHIDVSEVTDMTGLFACDNSSISNLRSYYNDRNPSEIDYQDINPDISKWNVSKVKNMYNMFRQCQNLSDLDLSNWNVSNVEDMRCLFQFCHKFNSDISKWNVSKVKDMGHMLHGCDIFDQDLKNWVVSKVENMEYMFKKCYKFNSELIDWDVSNVRNMQGMFEDCKSFDQDISIWDVKNVTNIAKSVFYDCPLREEYKPKFKK